MECTRLVRHASAGVAALAFVLGVALPAAAQVVTINGSEVDFTPAPMIQSGRVFVPLRGVFESLGASVVYSNGQINATGNGREISLQIGSNQATVNGQPETIDVAPFIIGASTFVPLRFVSQALGASVNWDNTNRIVAITTSNYSTQSSYAAPPSEYYSSYAPPPIPTYDQPDVPAPNEIWQPGYWASGPYGYYWVPGTWVEPPQPGYLWTPGYWAANNNGGFTFNQGFWALLVGFYGGVNYGNGYYGHGYDGGEWQGNDFRYNTYVTHVDTTVVKNVYVNKTVYVNNAQSNVSYNGGSNGIQERPTAEEMTVAKGNHVGLTPVQVQHVQTAAQDRRLLATVNHNTPPVLTVAHPLSENNHPEGFVPVTETDKVKPQPLPATHVAPAVEHTLPPATHTQPMQPVHTEAPALATPPPARPLPPVVHTVAPVLHTVAPFERTPVPAFHTAVPAFHAVPSTLRTPPPVLRTAPPAYRGAPPAFHAAPPARPVKLMKPAAHPSHPPHPEPSK